MGLAWFGYALLWRGYSMVRGYDLSNSDIISPTHYYKGAWPPPPAGNATIFPTGSTDNVASTASANAKASAGGVGSILPGAHGHQIHLRAARGPVDQRGGQQGAGPRDGCHC
jgi:hypothetical protein